VIFDEAGFEAARAEEQARARASWEGWWPEVRLPVYYDIRSTDFEGYQQTSLHGLAMLWQL